MWCGDTRHTGRINVNNCFLKIPLTGLRVYVQIKKHCYFFIIKTNKQRNKNTLFYDVVQSRLFSVAKQPVCLRKTGEAGKGVAHPEYTTTLPGERERERERKKEQVYKGKVSRQT